MLRYSSERHPKRLFRSQTKSAKVHPQNKHGHWKKTRATKTTYLGGGFKYLLISIPTWGRLPFWRTYFSNGLVQPPTRYSFLDLLVTSGVGAFYLHDEPLWCEGFRFQHLVNTEVFCADNPGKWRKFISDANLHTLCCVVSKNSFWTAQNILNMDSASSYFTSKKMPFPPTFRTVDSSPPSFKYSVVVSQIFISPRKLGKMNPFWRTYFSNGLGTNHQPEYEQFCNGDSHDFIVYASPKLDACVTALALFGPSRAARPSVRNPSVWPQQATGATQIGLEVVQLPPEMDRNMWGVDVLELIFGELVTWWKFFILRSMFGLFSLGAILAPTTIKAQTIFSWVGSIRMLFTWSS